MEFMVSDCSVGKFGVQVGKMRVQVGILVRHVGKIMVQVGIEKICKPMKMIIDANSL